MTGSYDFAWQVSIAFAVLAAALHWPIKDSPLPRLQAAE